MDLFNSATVTAPDFPDGLTWLNSLPLTLNKLKGKVVLVDFWTYSCINCQRTLPYLQKWWEKYQDSGLVLIGVHAPEFDFEKQEKNVKEALKKYGVDWPIVLDNDMKIWDLYANHYWPAKYLIDHQGKIIYSHFGEGNYIETELKIKEALKEAGFKVSESISAQDEDRNFFSEQTPELYFGSLRGDVEIIPQEIALNANQIYGIGSWKKDQQFLAHGRETKDLDDLVVLKYRARDVYLVMQSEDDEPIKVYVTQDAVGLHPENAGIDVKFDKEGRSYVEVTFSTLYHLISNQSFGDHTLRISTTSDKLRLFAFTFGA